jgi:ribosomal protein L31E
MTTLLFCSLGRADVCLKLPAQFEDNRIYLALKDSNGQSIRFYTDSGGGLFPFIYDDTVNRLALKTERTEQDRSTTIGYTTFPQKQFAHQGVQIDPSLNGKVRIFKYKQGGQDEPSQIRFMIGDGFLGASFFADKIWRFDYLNRELSLCKLAASAGFTAIPMMFKMTGGTRDTHQPRIEIQVDGEKIPVLFDTGATSLYSATAVTALKLQKPFTASSFIRESVAKRWLKSHPSWKVIKGGEKFAGGGDLIEVPLVSLGGNEVGPVWFATRKDEIYDRYSKDIMDSKIEGAVGGNLFRHITIIADYPASKLLVKSSAQ